jgi:hypothetical protein
MPDENASKLDYAPPSLRNRRAAAPADSLDRLMRQPSPWTNLLKVVALCALGLIFAAIIYVAIIFRALVNAFPPGAP